MSHNLEYAPDLVQAVWLNGVDAGSASVNPTPAFVPALLAVGGPVTTGQPGFVGNLHEILVYNRALSVTEREAVEDSLLQRYRLDDLDDDGLPDRWEREYFSDLTHDDSEDPDNDGLTNFDEYYLGTTPTSADTDGDGLPDGQELALDRDPLTPDASPVAGQIAEILIYNRALSGSERESVGFALLGKYRLGDTDNNRLPDAWENLHFGHLDVDRDADPDDDGLSNEDELRHGTDPNNPDTDGDGMLDGWEVAYGYAPLGHEPDAVLSADEDGDGLTLLQEAQAGTDPRNPDTDGDGLSDGIEVAAGFDPLHYDEDADGDGISNAEEIANGTDPVDYYNGQETIMTSLLPAAGVLIDGNHIAVRMTNAAGEPWVNAPVTFTASSSDHGFSPTLENKWTNARRSLRVLTDESGIATAYVVRADELLDPLP